jgi:hypothetical protein
MRKAVRRAVAAIAAFPLFDTPRIAIVHADPWSAGECRVNVPKNKGRSHGGRNLP